MICSSYIYRITQTTPESTTDRTIQQLLKENNEKLPPSTEITVLEDLLKKLGAEHPLQMLITGPAGSGKSNVSKIADQYLEIFCRECRLQWDPNSFLPLTTTGVAATHYNRGTTWQSGLEITSTTISPPLQKKFQNANTIIIDEVSFMSQTDLTTLHTRLCNIAACKNTANHLLPSGGYWI